MSARLEINGYTRLEVSVGVFFTNALGQLSGTAKNIYIIFLHVHMLFFVVTDTKKST